MLSALDIRDVVLIDRLALCFQDGLCVLTGETGAGKSILLDALGLALGARGDASLVRRSREDRRNTATVTAEFELRSAERETICELLAENGLEPPEPEEPLVLRRVLGEDGRSRAFVDDQPVGIALLREIGGALVEVEGQFASRGLLDPASHRDALDAFAGLEPSRRKVGAAYQTYRTAVQALSEAQSELERARAEEEWLRHAVGELDALEVQPGDEQTLAADRALLMNAEKLAGAVTDALEELIGGTGADGRLGAARRRLSQISDTAAGRLDETVSALDRALAEVAEATALLQRAAADFEADPDRLRRIDDRLHELRAVARKHGTDVDGLVDEHRRLSERLALLDQSTGNLGALTEAMDRARETYESAAKKLSAARAKAARALDKAVTKELAPLKLDKALFRTDVVPLDEQHWGAHGIDGIEFLVATNPGQSPGAIGRIASGGELARFMLALKVVLSESSQVPTVVFDEVDSGIGGATAAAVGERLRRLGDRMQVLVVTHSPQVAALGAAHWRVKKSEGADGRGDHALTHVDELSAPDRREEIARMLSGAQITEEARAAADSLLAGEHA
jgi:DNA repair protein RecN (Recombination protein N)